MLGGCLIWPISVRFVHYSADRVWRQFGLDQDIPDDFSPIMESFTSVRPFLWHTSFEFGVGILVQSLFQVHRGRVFVLSPCMGIGRS